MGNIEQVECIQLKDNTVIMDLKEKDGSFKRHYHRYGSREKAEYMYEVWRPNFEVCHVVR